MQKMPIKWPFPLLFSLAVVLLLCAGINLFADFRSSLRANDVLALQLNQSDALNFADKMARYGSLLAHQQALLAQNPIDPYGWARLSYLRKTYLGDRQGAFEALRQANMLAGAERLGLLERVLMWHGFADLHNDDDRAREEQMWRLAYKQGWFATAAAARTHGLGDVLERAVQKDPALLENWEKRRRFFR